MACSGARPDRDRGGCPGSGDCKSDRQEIAHVGEVVSGAVHRQHRRRSPERICPCHHRLDSRLNSHPGSLPSGGPADPALQGALHSGLTRTRSSPYGVLAPSVGRVVVNPVECDGWTVTSGWTGSGSAKRQRH